jgi:ABC-type antimicrobial peptide transport system, permease component
MFRNYLRIALRSLRANRVSSVVNIGGLAIGMAVALLIGMWIYSELSFDKQFPHYDRMATVMQNQTFEGEVQTWGSQALQLGPELRNRYGSNFKHVVMSSFRDQLLLSYDDKRLIKLGRYAEPAIIDLLSLQMIQGNATALNDMNSVIISQSTAKAFFGDSNPMGKRMKLVNKLDVTVTGVYKDLPVNSTFAGEAFIAPWQLLATSENLEQTVTWGNSWFQIFVEIAANTTMEKVSAAIKYSKLKRVLVEDDDARFKPEIFLHPMRNWHLRDQFKNGKNSGGAIQYVWLFGVVGIIVLLLACINFMNLSTARSEKRAREVGIRKTIGSLRSQLIGQFFGESILVAFLAFVLSLVLVILILPFFNEVAGKKMQIPLGQPLFWLTAMGFTLFTGLLAGSYPALYLSSFRPVKVLKGSFRVGRLAALPRKVLVVVQFTASIALIIATVIVLRQIQFAKNRPVGYNINRLINIPVRSENMQQHFEAFKTELLQSGVVEEVAGSQAPLTTTYATNSGYQWQGKDPNFQDEFITMGVTPGFGKTMGWRIKQGRDFSPAFKGDSNSIIINESAARYMRVANPLGLQLTRGPERLTIVGVVEDIVTQSPYQPVKQMFFHQLPGHLTTVNIKIKASPAGGEALQTIAAIYKNYDAVHPFEYRFLDQEYAKKFTAEERVGKLAGFFAVLAVMISCLGLFGLASFIAEQRTKEIGVRKVLGASVFHLWRLLSKEFLWLVLISVVMAAPLAYYCMHNWLQNFEYRTTVSAWVFAAAGLGTLIITVATVSYQSIKAAMMNPVKSLRTE